MFYVYASFRVADNHWRWKLPRVVSQRQLVWDLEAGAWEAGSLGAYKYKSTDVTDELSAHAISTLACTPETSTAITRAQHTLYSKTQRGGRQPDSTSDPAFS